MEKGAAFADSFVQSSVPFPSTVAKTELENYFDAHDKGAGIWKYRHYFPIYERHFRKFTGEEVHILEIGVYSGGSLEMWRHYFGERAFIYGVDINESCRVYENDYTRIDRNTLASTSSSMTAATNSTSSALLLKKCSRTSSPGGFIYAKIWPG